MTMIPIDAIILNPEQPRKQFDAVALQELADSIAENGLIQDITVEDNGDGTYTLVDGERRLRACRSLKHARIAASVRERSNHGGRELLVAALVTAVQREGLNAIEEAEGYARLRVTHGMSVPDIVRATGKHAVWIYNTLKLLDLEPEIREMIRAGKLTRDPRLVVELMRIRDTKVRVRLAEKLTDVAISLTGKIDSARRVADALTAPKLPRQTGKTDAPVIEIVGRRSGQEISENNPPARWDALVELKVLPPWALTVQTARATCNGCPLRDVANETTCGACPLIDFLRKSIRNAEA